MTADAPREPRMRKRFRNALKLLRNGRLSPPYRAPFDIVLRDATVTLRRYRTEARAHPAVSPSAADAGKPMPAGAMRRAVLLVPPLMVTSEIYDISPELSAVAFLAGHGVPTFVADFGAPESQEGGLDRTLDDHVLAVSRCIDHLISLTGGDVHLVGYSQGGMFCYQTAAYRKSAGIASLVTFGAPVDIRRNVPFKLNDKLAEKLITGMRRVIGRPLEGLRGIPGTLSSRGFKLMAPVGELRHLVQLFGILHDEEALARLEPKRRFLGGEGFTAWPGPALRTFIDEFVVGNRMKQGGFVIAGRTVALADITSPICYVVGEDDDLALPDAVRAIRTAAPRAQSYPVHVRAGHFGLVVGRAALSLCWPTVLAWTAWHDGRAERPAILDSAAEASHEDPVAGVSDVLWERMGKLGLRLGRVSDSLRWQFPRVVRRKLLELAERSGADAHGSLSRSLRDRAADLPNAVAFVFAGRAYTFLVVDQRVDFIARSLLAAGVVIGQRVSVVVNAHPDALTAMMALNRIGAVAVPIAAGALRTAAPDRLVVVPAGLGVAALRGITGPVATIGRRTRDVALDEVEVEVDPRIAPLIDPLVAHLIDLEVDVGDLPLIDPGRMHDAALLLPVAGDSDPTTKPPLSNRDWLMAGLDLAIDARLTTADTVYCPHSLDAAALTAGLAGALAGGARLQLGDPPTSAVPTQVWHELMNSGATVVLADDEVARELADVPLPERHTVRLVLGVGLASEIAAALVDRLGARTRYRALDPFASASRSTSPAG